MLLTKALLVLRVMASPTEHQVLCTNELLEAILVHLPAQELLFAQRVCRRWRALVQRSIHLREVLFLHPRCEPTTLPREMPWRMVRDVTPFTDPEDFVYGFSPKCVLTNDGGPVVWNPVLFGPHDESGVVVLTLSLTQAMVREDASTHGMHFTQPPVPLECQSMHYRGAGRKLLTSGQLDVHGDDKFGDWMARLKKMLADGREFAGKDVRPDKYMVVRQQLYVMKTEPEDDPAWTEAVLSSRTFRFPGAWQSPS